MTLFLVPTPIGNLEDITLRALRVLREVPLIAAEDTRTTGVLLRHYGIETRLTSYHDHNRTSKLGVLLAALAEGDVALVSDAGTPGISDPGFELVAAAIARGVRVEALPGANAAITALVASGLHAEAFTFVGFLPRKAKALHDALTALAARPETLIAYESPNRLADLLATAAAVFGPERGVCVARELSKVYEEYQRGPLYAVHAHYTAHPPRGECVVLFAGAPPAAAEAWSEAQLDAALHARLTAGESVRDAARALAAETGWDRRAVYARALAVREGTHGAAHDGDG
jgi:16S rRNA (cytidine1402-2'-O)-methyltransferase